MHRGSVDLRGAVPEKHVLAFRLGDADSFLNEH
jgi:hypothetical protein